MSAAAKVAVVTGGGTGIGRAVAIALARERYAVVIAGRRAEALTGVADEATAAGLRMLAVPTDVRDHRTVMALFVQSHDTFGRLDLLSARRPRQLIGG